MVRRGRATGKTGAPWTLRRIRRRFIAPYLTCEGRKTSQQSLLFGKRARRNPGVARILASTHTDGRFVVEAGLIEVLFDTSIRGVPVQVSLASAEAADPGHLYSVVESLDATVRPDFYPVTTVAARRIDVGMHVARCVFYIDIALTEEADSTDVTAVDHAMSSAVDVVAELDMWVSQVWEWITVLGGRVQPPFQTRALYPVAHVTLHDNTTMPFYMLPDAEPPSVDPLAARHLVPISQQAMQEVFQRVERGEGAPVAPLLMFDAVERIRQRDLRTAMVLVGGALDFVLDAHWDVARRSRADLGDLSGTLGSKMYLMSREGVGLPLGLTREELQQVVVRVRNQAAHGDPMVEEEVAAAVSMVIEAVRELWPEAEPRGGASVDEDDPSLWEQVGPYETGMRRLILRLVGKADSEHDTAANTGG